MKLLLDTHVILWLALGSDRVSPAARVLVGDSDNDVVFSALNIWEIAIKRSLGRPEFGPDPRILRRRLLDQGYEELAITSAHAAMVEHLPLLHRDPFDRLLLAQAISEGMILLTADRQMLQYGQPTRAV